jgi:hypothetical protein
VGLPWAEVRGGEGYEEGGGGAEEAEEGGKLRGGCEKSHKKESAMISTRLGRRNHRAPNIIAEFNITSTMTISHVFLDEQKLHKYSFEKAFYLLSRLLQKSVFVPKM